MKTQSPARTDAGFTLLEAIVAIAIVAMALIPLLSFISQAANQLERAADSNDRSFVMQSAMALMEPVNPLTEPTGELPLESGVKIAWQSTVLVPPNDGVMMGGGLSGFHLGFYKVHVIVSRDNAPQWFEFDLRKIGYDRIVSSFSMDGRK